MKRILFFLSTTSVLILTSCNKEVKAKKGAIDIISNIYFNASQSLDSMQSFHVSKLNYLGDSVIEIVPKIDMPNINSNIYFILDSTYYMLGSHNYILKDIRQVRIKDKAQNVLEKPNGAIFTKFHLPNFAYRHEISDTILFGKKYKRFEIKSPDNFTRYYVNQTDTILPYTLYGEAGKQYKGRIERVDSYNKKKDIFVSLQLIPRDNWDKEAQDIFEFNQYLNNIVAYSKKK